MRSPLLVGGALALLSAGVSEAATLRDALISVYNTNPTLTGQRASQRATDEGVPIARAGALPNAQATGGYSEFVVQNSNSFIAPKRQATAGVDLTVPIYQGGAVRNGIRAADTRVLQGRAQLRSVEAQLFTQAVGAYLDVIRDQAIAELNRGNVRVLETNLQASRDRFEVGDLTRTDVAQSDARLAIARSQLQSALAQLDSSRENYLRLVGATPDRLEPPPPLPDFPANPDDAVDVALANNPDLEAARQAQRAADYDVRVANAGRLPRLSAFASGDYANFLGTLGSTGAGSTSQHQRSVTVGLQATLPLFQGGLPGARVRQAQALSSQATEQIIQTERAVVADARATYSLYAAAQGVIRSSEQAVAANELALEGTRAENSVGTRNVLDVLNAEQELLNTRVQLVTARRDAYVAGFALLASIGRAESKDLNLDGGPLYDPAVNYKRVRNSINDWASDGKPVPVATRTVGIELPSQTLSPPPEAVQPRSGTPAAPTTQPQRAIAPAPVTPPASSTPANRPPVAVPPGTEPAPRQPAAQPGIPQPGLPEPGLGTPRPIAFTKPVARAAAAWHPGAYVVQLGAFARPTAMRAMWSDACRRVAGLAGYPPGRARDRATGWHRLSVTGFGTRLAAASLCARARASGIACFVRRPLGDAPLMPARVNPVVSA